jgi:hypothetical protein
MDLLNNYCNSDSLHSLFSEVNLNIIGKIVSYGIGSLSSSVDSEWQTAFVLLLKEVFENSGKICKDNNPDYFVELFFFDPCCKEIDYLILKEFGFKILYHNEV